MNTIIKNIFLFTVLCLGSHSVFAQSANPVISAIQKEVDRSKSGLKMEGMGLPFFISYSVIDIYNYNLSASLGSIGNFNQSHYRLGVPKLLVGDYMRNTAKSTGRAFAFPLLTSLSDNSSGIPFTIWKGLDGLYKNAAEQYKAQMAILQQQTQTDEEKNLPDFEQVKPIDMVSQPLPNDFNKAYWEDYLRKTSETAKQYPGILSSNVTLNVRNVMTYTYNTEGSRYAVPSTLYQLVFTASTRATDGQDLDHTIWVENPTMKQMPDIAAFSNQCKALMETLLKLKEAPVVTDAYFGPVLFEGTGVNDIFRKAFFSNNKMSAAPKTIQIFNNNQGQDGSNDFELMLNKRVISNNITMKSITGQESYKGQRLNGYYPVDAEGVVPDKELMLIENGVLRNLLNGRKPTKKIQHSNGHARYDYGNNSLSVIPGNILITCNQTFSNDELRKKLLASAKEKGLDYAYIVRWYSIGRNLFYKIYVADGHEELVRDAIIADDANLKSFNHILGASDKENIVSYNEVQSTIIVPDAVLFEEMDITRTPNIEFKKPYFVQKPN